MQGRDSTGQYGALAAEAQTLANLLGDIRDWYEKVPESKKTQLLVAYETCKGVLSELDKVVRHYNGLDTQSKRTWDRINWDPEKYRTLRDRLTASVAMVTAFNTSLIHDSQVLILDALERLGQEYRGGFREGSIASVQIIASSSSDDGMRRSMLHGLG